MNLLKPASLKAALTDALDPAHHIAENPDRLQVELLEGSVHALGRQGFGFQYRYEVAVGVLDFAGDLDEVMIPLLVWLKRWEPSYFLNHAQADQGVRFEYQRLNDETGNILLTLKLTEAVGFNPRPGDAGGFDAVHRKDPPIMDTGAAAPLHRLYINGELAARCTPHPVSG